MEKSGGILVVFWLPLLEAEIENLSSGKLLEAPPGLPASQLPQKHSPGLIMGTKDETGGQSPSRELTAASLPLPTCGETGQDWFKVHYR